MRRDGGRLFQTSGPQTANARRPSSLRVRRVTAAQVDAERRDHCCGSDAQKATRSATYDGQELGDEIRPNKVEKKTKIKLNP